MGGRDAGSEGFRDVFFIDASTGWVVGSSIYKTTDGGTSWTKQYGNSSSELDAISFSDPLNGWATGYNNLVLHTTDGGQTWVPQNVGAPPLTAITGVTAINSTTAWIAGWYGFVAETRNGGQSWRRETVPGAEESTSKMRSSSTPSRDGSAGTSGSGSDPASLNSSWWLADRSLDPAPKDHLKSLEQRAK